MLPGLHCALLPQLLFDHRAKNLLDMKRVTPDWGDLHVLARDVFRTAVEGRRRATAERDLDDAA